MHYARIKSNVALLASVLLLALIATPAQADVGISPGTTFTGFAYSPSFSALKVGMPVRWVRVPVGYDTIWTSNGTGCVTTGSSAQLQLFNEIWTAEHLGLKVILVMSAPYWGAPNPSADQLRCGVAGIEYAISSWRLGQWGMPIEAWNEPDFNQPNGALPVGQAVNFFIATVQAGWGNQWFRPVAGTFSTGYNVDQPNSYAWQYIQELASTSYNQWATSWSWHDYGDVVYSTSCSRYDLAACSDYEVKQMLALLRGWREPTSDTWVTESGGPKLFQSGQTPNQEAHEAYAWERLKGAGEMHLLWYQYQTTPGDTWDSALLDPDPSNPSVISGYGPRDPSFCVLAYNELPTKALQTCRG